MRGQRQKRNKYPISAEMHAEIKAVYLIASENGEINALAAKLGYPRWKITRYAQEQGWIQKVYKQPNWTEAELEVLKANAHHAPDVIQRQLYKHGFSRSVTGIILRRKRSNFLKQLDGRSATHYAKCFGVDIHFILDAILRLKLKARKRGTKRTENQGGDNWYILPEDVKEYIENHIEEIDIRKVDKIWFVKILTDQITSLGVGFPESVAPTLHVVPDEKNALRFSRQRIQPTLKDAPHKPPAEKKDSGQVIIVEPKQKKGYCTCCKRRKVGANLARLCEYCYKHGPSSEVIDEHQCYA